jgi:hypothetical protein
MDLLRSHARQLTDATKENADNATERESAMRVVLAQEETAFSTLQALQQPATTDAGNVTAMIKKIKTVGAGADAMEKQVASYAGTFEAFQKQLDGRNAEFVQFR